MLEPDADVENFVVAAAFAVAAAVVAAAAADRDYC